MIQTSLEPDRRRVMIRSGSRILGEIIYQIQTDSGWCSPVEFSKTGDCVSVRLVGASGNRTVECRIDDRFVAAEDALVIDRSWEFSDVGEYRLLFNYRVLERELIGRVVPGLEYRQPSHIALPSVSFAAQETAIHGCVAYIGEDRCQAICLDDPTKMLVPELRTLSEVSDRFPALQYSFPDTERGPRFLRVSRRDGPSRVGLRVILLAGDDRPDKLLRALHERAFALVDGGDEALPIDWSKVRSARLSLVREHLLVTPRNAAVRPMSRRGDPRLAEYSTAVRPFWSLDAARVLLGGAQEGEANEDHQSAMQIARFYLQGLRPDGGYRDAHDPATGRWGSIGGDGEWIRDMVQLPHAADAGMRFLSLSAQLQARRIEEPRLSWAATEIGEYVMRRQTESGAYNIEEPASPAHGSSGVSLLVRLQHIRGRNSLRSASLRRSVPYYRGVANDIGMLIESGGERDTLLELLRALIDAAEAEGTDENKIAAKQVASFMLSWVFSHDIVFPKNSLAGELNVSTTGLGAVSLQRHHLDLEGAPIALELLRMHRMTGDPYYRRVAKRVLVAGQQLLSGVTFSGRIGLRRYPTGWQPAEIDHANWSTTHGLASPMGRILGSRIGQVCTTMATLLEIHREFPDAFYSTTT